MKFWENKYMWLTGGGIFLLSFLFFQLLYPYHLFFKEQLQLFLYSADYFITYFSKPAWLACYVGDFLTQFFYLRGGGALVLSSLLVLEWLVTVRGLRWITSTNFSWIWALIPVVSDFILFLDLLHPVSSSIGYLIILGLFLLYRATPDRFAFAIALLVSISGYWLVGSMAFLFPVLVIASSWQQRKTRILQWMIILIICLIIPLLARENYLLTLAEAYYYPAFNFQIFLVEGCLLLVSILLLFLFKKETKRLWVNRFVASLLILLIVALGISLKANFTFEKIASFDTEYYFGNYDRVIELAQKNSLKNKYTTYYTNLALAQRGEMPDRLLQFYQPMAMGLMLPVHPDESWQSIFFSNEVFFLVGDLNLAQHSAMLGMTFSPYQRSSRMVKRLAEINLLNEDTAATMKYLRLLDKTLFYKKWAEARILLLHPSSDNKWIRQRRSLLPARDTIRNSNDYDASLKFLVANNPNNVAALDYLLCNYLLNKDLKSFRETYDRFGMATPRIVPSLYQEALMIQLYTEGSLVEELNFYSISPAKVKDFLEYTDHYEKVNGVPENLQERYGQTYWFYYHFATLQKR